MFFIDRSVTSYLPSRASRQELFYFKNQTHFGSRNRQVTACKKQSDCDFEFRTYSRPTRAIRKTSCVPRENRATRLTNGHRQFKRLKSVGLMTYLPHVYCPSLPPPKPPSILSPLSRSLLTLAYYDENVALKAFWGEDKERDMSHSKILQIFSLVKTSRQVRHKTKRH